MSSTMSVERRVAAMSRTSGDDVSSDRSAVSIAARSHTRPDDPISVKAGSSRAPAPPSVSEERRTALSISLSSPATQSSRSGSDATVPILPDAALPGPSDLAATVRSVTEVVVFHHAQGLTPGVLEFAEHLRAAGHRVTVPDLYGGKTFPTLDAGIGHAERIGFPKVVERGLDAVDVLPDEVVLIGFSLGVLPAQMLAQTRAGALGAVLIDACVRPSEFGGPWPRGVALQVHGMDADPLFVEEGDLAAARDLVAAVENAELFLYPGDQHLFADSSLEEFDPAASELLRQRVLTFLSEFG